jgi:hypothetical protein
MGNMDKWLSGMKKNQDSSGKKKSSDVDNWGFDPDDLSIYGEQADGPVSGFDAFLQYLAGEEKPSQYYDDTNTALTQARSYAESTGKWPNVSLIEDYAGIQPGSDYKAYDAELDTPFTVELSDGTQLELTKRQFQQMEDAAKVREIADTEMRQTGIQEVGDLFGASVTGDEENPEGFAGYLYDLMGNKDTDLALQKLGELDNKERMKMGVSTPTYEKANKVMSGVAGKYNYDTSMGERLDHLFGTETVRKVDDAARSVVPVITQWAQELYKQGDIQTLVQFVTESGMGADATFGRDEAMRAFNWIYDHESDDDFKKKNSSIYSLFNTFMTPGKVSEAYVPNSGAMFSQKK